MDGLSIAASLTEITPHIVGSTVRTIYHPDSAQFVLRVFSGADVRLMIDLRDASIRTLRQAMDNPSTPSSFVMLLRKHLRGGRIAEVTQWEWDRVVSLDVTRMEGTRRLSYKLIAELVGTRGNLLLFQDDRLIQALRSDDRNAAGRPYAGLQRQAKLDPGNILPSQMERWLADESPIDALTHHVEGIGRKTAADIVAQATSDDDLALGLCMRLRETLSHVEDLHPHISVEDDRATFYPLPMPAKPVDSYQEALDRVRSAPSLEQQPPQDSILKELKTGIRKRERTIDKLLEWLENSTQADLLQGQADLLMTFQSEIARGSDRVELVHPADNRLVKIPLDPALTAIENAQALYKRAKRIRRGHPHVHHRLKRSREELELLKKGLVAHQQDEAVDSAILALLPSRRNKKRPPPKKAVPFREFETDGYRIWVGKSARQNDTLLKAASANDIWMHAKGFAGSHVVIRAQGQREIPEAVLRSAARLAALHSKAKTERRVEVTMTQVKNVRKPKGAPAGLVNVRDTDTLTVELAEGDS